MRWFVVYCDQGSPPIEVPFNHIWSARAFLRAQWKAAALRSSYWTDEHGRLTTHAETALRAIESMGHGGYADHPCVDVSGFWQMIDTQGDGLGQP